MENNNYSSLVFGKQPLNLISKPNEINTILSDCRGNNPINYVYLLTGIRGSGKTNLLANIANLLRSDED